MKTTVLVLLVGFFLFVKIHSSTIANQTADTFWEVQSIDTMKFSRDVAREKASDSDFDSFIDMSVKNIAATGATHVAIGTPYDKEFDQFMRRWVRSARRYGIGVWFRGNLSGWEGWFDYPKISREEHTAGVIDFINRNHSVFQDGDIFTSCPECENGGPGDPRHNGDVEGHRKFLIEEYSQVKNAFKTIRKQVRSNTYSMNGDVTELIMDTATTDSLDNIIVPDHYVKSPQQTLDDLREYAQKGEGSIILGEFGIPIPDIHGAYNETHQAEWLDRFFSLAIQYPEVIGFNYWTHAGGSTELWNNAGNPKRAVATIKKYYSPAKKTLTIKNSFGRTIKKVSVTYKSGVRLTNSHNGTLSFIYLPGDTNVSIESPKYKSILVELSSLSKDHSDVVLILESSNIISKIQQFLGLL